MRIRPPKVLPKFVPADGGYAAVGVSAAWGLSAVIQSALGERAGAALPYAVAALALVGGLRAVTSSRRVLRSGAVGLMLGAHLAFATGFQQMPRLGIVLTPVLAGALYFGWFGFWFGWLGYATGGRCPFGDPRVLRERVEGFFKQYGFWLTAALWTVGELSRAGADVRTLGFVATSVAGALGVGLLAGERAAAHFHATRLAPADDLAA